MPIQGYETYCTLYVGLINQSINQFISVVACDRVARVSEQLTISNQRLCSAGDNDRRSKRFCSNAVLGVNFTWQIVKTRVIRLREIEGSNVRDQIALCAFHSFLVEVQINAGYILDPSAYGSGNVRVITYMRMRNKNPEIRIAGSPCRLQ